MSTNSDVLTLTLNDKICSKLWSNPSMTGDSSRLFIQNFSVRTDISRFSKRLIMIVVEKKPQNKISSVVYFYHVSLILHVSVFKSLNKTDSEEMQQWGWEALWLAKAPTVMIINKSFWELKMKTSIFYFSVFIIKQIMPFPHLILVCLLAVKLRAHPSPVVFGCIH